MIVYFRGHLVEAGEARISALSPAFTRGPNVFETVRGYLDADRGQLNLFRLHDHLARFRFSMKSLRFEGIPELDLIAGATLDCIRANDLRDDMHLRFHAFPSEEDGGSGGSGTDLLIVAEPRPAKAIKPARCRIASWRLTSDDSLPARVKTVGYRMFGRVAAAEAKADGYDHILLLNDRGRLAESLLSNLFVVRHGVACTPAATESILEGVTRTTLLTILGEDLGRVAEEREIDRSELVDCEEAFLCSTGLEIVPISSVDGMAFDGRVPGRLTSELTAQYHDVLRGKVAGHRDWLTPVYA